MLAGLDSPRRFAKSSSVSPITQSEHPSRAFPHSLGQLRLARSALVTIPTAEMLREWTGGPSSPVSPLCAEVCLSSYPVKGLRGLTGVLDEKFRDRAERAVL
jgi:hypothetical protein